MEDDKEYIWIRDLLNQVSAYTHSRSDLELDHGSKPFMPQIWDENLTLHAGIWLYVKMHTGKIVYLPFYSSNTIDIIKQQIRDKEGVPIYFQRLIFAGTQLEEGQETLSGQFSQSQTIHGFI